MLAPSTKEEIELDTNTIDKVASPKTSTTPKIMPTAYGTFHCRFIQVANVFNTMERNTAIINGIKIVLA